MIVNGIPVTNKSTIKDYRVIYYEASDYDWDEMEKEGERFAKFLLEKCPTPFLTSMIEKLKGNL